MYTHICFLLFGLVITNLVSADGKVSQMPSELLSHAKKNNCSQIPDFFNRPGMVNPPYVYGYLEGEKENSAVFWCKSKSTDPSPYKLIIWIKSPNKKQLACKDTIDWRNYPGGLEIHSKKETVAGRFVELENTDRKTIVDMRLSHSAILSTYDGKSELFYCYNGKWFVRQTH